MTQDIVLGVDAGSKHIGLSATTNKKELYREIVLKHYENIDDFEKRFSIL